MHGNREGLFVDFEGGDASGKATQTAFLQEELSRMTDKPVSVFSFPRYKQSGPADLVTEMTRGDHGDPLKMSPKIASLPFTLDRVLARDDLQKALSQGHLICDRYVPSNLAYQAAKFEDASEQDEYVRWLEKLEYEECGVPRPDLVLFLDVSPHISRRLLLERGRLLDKHESSLAYQERVYEVYARLSRERTDWKIIRCLDEKNELRSQAEIRQQISAVVLEYYQCQIEE
jgi:dTMP kinase